MLIWSSCVSQLLAACGYRGDAGGEARAGFSRVVLCKPALALRRPGAEAGRGVPSVYIFQNAIPI